MLAIRMQRTGRKGHAMFRVIVQEARLTPTSGKIVAALGSYDPHSKTSVLDKEKATVYLQNGAQPSPRVVRLLKSEGVKLPDWVILDDKKAGKLKNQEKLRKNRPVEPKAEEPAIEEAVETPDTSEEVTAETVEEVAEKPAEAEPAESSTDEPEAETTKKA